MKRTTVFVLPVNSQFASTRRTHTTCHEVLLDPAPVENCRVHPTTLPYLFISKWKNDRTCSIRVCGESIVDFPPYSRPPGTRPPGMRLSNRAHFYSRRPGHTQITYRGREMVGIFDSLHTSKHDVSTKNRYMYPITIPQSFYTLPSICGWITFEITPLGVPPAVSGRI